MNAERPLPYTRHQVDDEDVAAVSAVLRGEWLTGGPVVERFEQELASLVGARHAVACSSGTAALHLACLGLGIGPGDLAVVPDITFVATANAPRLAGADVVLADVDPDTGLLREADIEQALARAGRNARALIPVHLNGQAAPMEGISACARRQGLAVIEDACHALGTRYRISTGESGWIGDCRFSDAAVFSFHPAKVAAMGEGGAIVTNDENLARTMRRARNHGLVHDPGEFRYPEEARDEIGSFKPWYSEMQTLGLNYRASDIHCALGLSQLHKLPRFAARRAALMCDYDETLEPLAPVVRPVPRVADCEPVLHLYPVFIEFGGTGRDRSAVMRALRTQGIGTQVHYRPVHAQPYYRQYCPGLDLPGAQRYYERVLSLPFFPGMTGAEIRRVAAALRDALGLSA